MNVTILLGLKDEDFKVVLCFLDSSYREAIIIARNEENEEDPYGDVLLLKGEDDFKIVVLHGGLVSANEIIEGFGVLEDERKLKELIIQNLKDIVKDGYESIV